MRRCLLNFDTIMNAFVVFAFVTYFQMIKPEVVDVADDLQAHNTIWGNGSADAEKSVEDRIKELRIEMVKFQILSRLNLKEPPQTVSSSSDISQEVVKLLLQDTEDEQQAPSYRLDSEDRLIIPATGSYMECLQRNISSCKMFRYEFSTALNMSAMDLWVYKLGEIPAGISAFWTLSGSNEEKYYDSFYFQVQQPGWNKFRLLHSIFLPSSWNDSIESSVEIVGGDIEHEGARSPYLMASRSLVRPSRRRRDSECDANESCCKRPLRLSFAEIGFDFIVYPAVLEANMCVGKCRLDHSTLRTHYERALTTTIEKNSTIREALGECWTLCCKPKQLKQVRVIYKDMENMHHVQFIPDLSVESCSCS